jgi:hypothetical protein
MVRDREDPKTWTGGDTAVGEVLLLAVDWPSVTAAVIISGIGSGPTRWAFLSGREVPVGGK